MRAIDVVTNGTGTIAQWFDYAPYGSVIASTNTGSTTDARQYIGQFSDASGLSYLNARYYNGAQGQFTSEDPVFWGQQNVQDPQSLNSGRTMGGSSSASASGWNGSMQSGGSSIFPAEYLAEPQMQNPYSYSDDNPISLEDPNGRGPELIPIILGVVEVYGWAMNSIDAYNAYNADIAYPNITTSQQKAQANGQFVYDRLEGTIASDFTKAGWKRVAPGIGVLQAASDAITTAPDVANYYRSGAFTSDARGLFNWVTTATAQVFSTSQSNGSRSRVQTQLSQYATRAAR